MALTRLQLGDLFLYAGGTLERKFIGCILDHACQIHAGGYANPNANQLAWKDYIFGSTKAEKEREARKAMEWGLTFNSSLQDQGEALDDGALSWITAEYTKTWTASGGE
jgi:hypothetical protein